MATVTETFESIGARARILPAFGRHDFYIDVDSDTRGEYFALGVAPNIDMQPLDARPKERHLVLLVRGEEKLRFLCGHDERHWFAAAVPGRITTVAEARDSLKPFAVRDAERALPKKLRDRRRNPAYVRQGEWFFVPAPDAAFGPEVILRKERLSRGRGSTPHIAEEAVRFGGEVVFVCSRHPQGVSESEYGGLVKRVPGAAAWGWRVEKRDPEVYVRGRISHRDHATVILKGWHRVLMNTEGDSNARSYLVFLD